MSILTLILVIVAVGVLLWAVNTYVPMQPPLKTILNVLVVIVLVLWILRAFGLLAALGTARI